MMINKWIFIVLSLIAIQACTNQENPLAYQTESHSRGDVDILVEESFKRLFDTSIYTFQGLYPKAKINAKYLSENDVLDAFYKDQAKSFVISRDLTKAERTFLKSKKVEVRSEKIAIDAIAIIVNPANLDTALTVEQLKAILTGKVNKWKNGQSIDVIYDNNNSANYNYLKDFCDMTKSPKNVFSVNSNEEVINYVKKSKNALGVIGLNWISDEDDFDVLGFLDGIKVVSLAKDAKSPYFLPYAGMIYTKEYPLIRDIWMHNKGGRAGLNTGFAIFMAGEKGQIIINKCGLVPAKSQVRLIQFTDSY